MNKILIGFSAGIIVGILFAPSKGTKTRKRIARKGKQLKNRFDELVDSVSDKMESAADAASDMAGEQQSRAWRQPSV